MRDPRIVVGAASAVVTGVLVFMVCVLGFFMGPMTHHILINWFGCGEYYAAWGSVMVVVFWYAALVLGVGAYHCGWEWADKVTSRSYEEANCEDYDDERYE